MPHKQDQKKRLPRIERTDVVVVREDENANLWAVSYADFLMALLSFFVLFYSADPDKRENLIFNLSKQFSQYGGGAGELQKVDRGPAQLSESLVQAANRLNFKVERQGQILTLNFADNMYRPGRYDFPKKHEQELKEVLQLLKAHQGSINLYFEGHADNQPLIHHKTSVVKDNYILSSLRASTALKLASDMGIDENNMFIKASSSNTRNTRSLSIRIEVKGVGV